YAKQADVKKEKHLAAMESDRGGFTPRGFTMSVPDKTKTLVQSWKPMLEPYGLTDFSQEGGGADIGPLGPLGVPLFGYLPDSQRYFDYHHTQEDTIDKVNKRELELGAAAMAALTYLIDSSGLK
ncbi:MAG: peptidase M28 family protein, partial [Chryseotalea sp.]